LRKDTSFGSFELRTVLFWVITQWVVVISYQCFGTSYWSHPQSSRIQNKPKSKYCPIHTNDDGAWKGDDLETVFVITSKVS
jgi:hypothetical protein